MITSCYNFRGRERGVLRQCNKIKQQNSKLLILFIDIYLCLNEREILKRLKQVYKMNRRATFTSLFFDFQFINRNENCLPPSKRRFHKQQKREAQMSSYKKALKESH